MITCDVCGHLNDSSRATCEECGSDLSDSPDWDTYDDLEFDESDEMGYYDSMEKLENDLNELNIQISNLEKQISEAEKRARSNIVPLKEELDQVKRDKTLYASKNDSASVSDCIRREDNLKFRITARWNESLDLKDELTRLKKTKKKLEYEIHLEKDKIRRKNQIMSEMDSVLDNYRKSRSLKQAAVDSNINPNTVEQWYEWGRNGFNETSTYFYTKIIEIDEEFKKREAQNLKEDMDKVIEAFKKTRSLRSACELAGASYDTAQYWYKWGSMGVDENNAYFYRKIRQIK